MLRAHDTDDARRAINCVSAAEPVTERPLNRPEKAQKHKYFAGGAQRLQLNLIY
ncbi:hypothetical protein GGD41_000773 [Paraburkholderia bryophila]|uniref:Uncharacterized protein n=1 Tax=Paraburkholderia bryophila TaxID=420952 RepID=A0A7Y9W4F1_9BURK|nr:hypothetical protein [Paraburkholderia bryophila]